MNKSCTFVSESEAEAVAQFDSSFAHVLAELRRIDVLLRLQVSRARQEYQNADEFQGLYISEQQVDEILANAPGLPEWATNPAELAGMDVAETIRQIAEDIEQKKQAGLEAGIEYRLDVLRDALSLSQFDMDVVLLCLAREIDLRYERLFAYLQNDITKKAPGVDLVLNLLCRTLPEKISNRNCFSVDMPLRAYNIIELFDDESKQNSGLLGKSLRLDGHVADFILESAHTDRRLNPYITFYTPARRFEDVQLDEDLKQHFERLQELNSQHGGAVLYFQGPDGVGKKSTIEALCAHNRIDLLCVDVAGLLKNAEFDNAIGIIIREAVLHRAALYFMQVDELQEPSNGKLLDRLLSEISDIDQLVFLGGSVNWEAAEVRGKNRFFRIEFKRQDYGARVNLWQRFLHDIPSLKQQSIDELAGRFRLTGRQIRDAAHYARNLAYWRNPAADQLTEDDLYQACREQSNHKLAKLAQKIMPHYSWDDIVLPPKKLRHLRDIYNASKFRSKVYDKWGFDRKLSLGKGLNVLFSGPSGTGKTMAAEIIAHELGLDFYKIDLSSVVSKYIGETEKNLSRIFAEAETANAILFFDEADALFGKRSEVRDAHDRYANIETGYLLQKMEEYDGVVILATNLDKNMDEAFSRRMQFVLDFPLPNSKERQRIWEKVWPSETPLDNDVDLAFMAERFKLAGGNIKNIALTAAFLAAESGDAVKMQHLVNALHREYQKMGKVATGEEYGQYGKLLTA